MGDGEVGPCSKMMFAVCSGFSPALDLKITSPSALGAAAAGRQQFPAVSGKSLPRKGSLCPLEQINLLFSALAGTRRSSPLKHNVPPQSFRNELFPRNPRTPTNFPEIPLPTAGSPAGKAEYPFFFSPSQQGLLSVTHREVFLSFPFLLSRLFLTRNPLEGLPGLAAAVGARWMTSGASAEVTSSKITRAGLRRSRSHCSGINHPGSCWGNRCEPGMCHGELRACRDVSKFRLVCLNFGGVMDTGRFLVLLVGSWPG